MNEPRDPLEEELLALRPVDISPSLRQRLNNRLSDRPQPAAHRRRWLIAWTGGLVAACLVAALVAWHSGNEPSHQTPMPHHPTPTVSVKDRGPALLVYQQALAGPPDAFDVLLDKDAAMAPTSEPPLAPALVLSRSDSVLNALLGEH